MRVFDRVFAFAAIIPGVASTDFSGVPFLVPTSPGRFAAGSHDAFTVFEPFGDQVSNRVYSPKDGWGPLCKSLGAAETDVPCPRVNSRDEIQEVSDEEGGLPPDPETAERFARDYIESLRAKAFGR